MGCGGGDGIVLLGVEDHARLHDVLLHIFGQGAEIAAKIAVEFPITNSHRYHLLLLVCPRHAESIRAQSANFVTQASLSARTAMV